MFRKVMTQAEELLYDRLARSAWEYLVYEQIERSDLMKYILLDELEQEIGTFSFIPYKPDSNLLSSLEPCVESFKEFLPEDAGKVVEISKFSILKEQRSNENNIRAVTSMLQAAMEDGEITQAVAVTSPSVFVLLKRYLKVPVKKVVDDFYLEEYKKDFCGIVIDVEEVKKSEKFLSKLLVNN